MNIRTALITGVTGKNGALLADFLLKKGYEVHGIIRHGSEDFRRNTAHLENVPHFHLHFAQYSIILPAVKRICMKCLFYAQNAFSCSIPRQKVIIKVPLQPNAGWGGVCLFLCFLLSVGFSFGDAQHQSTGTSFPWRTVR